ncbi:MAG: DNA phosphorothioation-associated protein 4 [Syntrophomonadaceae bacterium]|nr:DNA phosphorothioation-associated protein 4 [Syntrophomonadaceae bacterium]
MGRIRAPKDKKALIDKLVRGDDNHPPFRTQADLLNFAAALAFSRGGVVQPFTESLDNPIRQEVFERQGYDTAINLVALAMTEDIKILVATDEAEATRIQYFEELANAGLEILQNELEGVVDPLEHLLLLVGRQRQDENGEEEFDLSRFIG